MEKTGDLLNQLAIIVDLIEKTNLNFKTSTIVFEIPDKDHVKTLDYIVKKRGENGIMPFKSFSVKLGTVDIIFNRSNDETIQSV